MFETYLPEYGALFDKLPISAFVWKKDFKEEEPLTDIRSYGIVLVIIFKYGQRETKNCDVVKYLLKGGGRMGGEYMFTIDNANGEQI